MYRFPSMPVLSQGLGAVPNSYDKNHYHSLYICSVDGPKA